MAGETVVAGPYAISATLSPTAVLSNYNITYNTANFTITTRPITVTANSGQTKVYGANDPTFTYSITSGNLVDGMVDGQRSTTALRCRLKPRFR